MRPFLTLYTPTFKRPQALARCLASVAEQTIIGEIEQLVIPDHVGIGVAGMYARVPDYVGAVHGRYVMFLCDDDVLNGPTVIECVKAFAEVHDEPELILVATQKGDATWPAGHPWPPREGTIDLNCAIVRADIWKQHVHAYSAQARYEGDCDFLQALYEAQVQPHWLGIVVSCGAVSRGAPELLPVPAGRFGDYET